MFLRPITMLEHFWELQLTAFFVRLGFCQTNFHFFERLFVKSKVGLNNFEIFFERFNVLKILKTWRKKALTVKTFSRLFFKSTCSAFNSATLWISSSSCFINFSSRESRSMQISSSSLYRTGILASSAVSPSIISLNWAALSMTSAAVSS